MGWFAVALLSSIVVSAQTSHSTYYYYRGDSIYLPLNNQHFFAYVDTAKISLDELEQEYKVTEVAGASAQSYTKVFDSVFQHVDLSHTSSKEII